MEYVSRMDEKIDRNTARSSESSMGTPEDSVVGEVSHYRSVSHGPHQVVHPQKPVWVLDLRIIADDAIHFKTLIRDCITNPYFIVRAWDITRETMH